jgi:glycogen debranching enzyme
MSTDSLPSNLWGTEQVPDQPFYIPATGSSNRPRYTMKHGDSFLVIDSHGDVGAAAGGPDGLFHLDTRYLSHFELLINGRQPLLLGTNLSDDSCIMTVDLTNPDIFYNNRVIVQKDLLHISRTIFVWRGTIYHRFSVRNFGAQRVRLLLSLTFDNDFADLFEVRGTERTKHGVRHAEVGEKGVKLAYVGLDHVMRRTEIRFDPPPDDLSRSLASFRLDLEPQKSVSLYATVSCDPISSESLPFLKVLRRAHREMKQRMDVETKIYTSNPLFNEVLRRSTADLAMLMTDTPQGPYPYAGIPWYSTTFGRDGLITALQCLWLDRRIPLAVLRRLAAMQATDVDPASDAEPGKILHEMRAGEMANLREVPFGKYYGSVDATPLFVLLAGQYARTTGDIESLKGLWPAIDRALAWIDGPGDLDRDGFVEYYRATEQGLANQGWKDSYDAIFHADGCLAEGPIALAEVQGYVYAAKRLASWCARQLGFVERARLLAEQADRLAERFEQAFWCDEIGTYAPALDGDKKPCRVRTSNAGQVLFSGIAQPERARRVVRGLMDANQFSGWGIRTVSTAEPRFNPMSYHNGSVWPHDNALIASGFSHYGANKEAARLFRALYDVANYMDLRRLPELFCGFPRYHGRGPTLYPVACSPQAWAAGAFFMLLQASLGVRQDSQRREICFERPALPDFLDEVVLKGLAVGDGEADIAVRRRGAGTVVEVLDSRGDLTIRTELVD